MSRLPLEAELAAVFEKVRRRDGGEVATYIPALAKADPDWFGVSLMTVDGGSYSLGDSEEPFTIQSVSKPFMYGYALAARGQVLVPLVGGGRLVRGVPVDLDVGAVRNPRGERLRRREVGPARGQAGPRR